MRKQIYKFVADNKTKRNEILSQLMKKNYLRRSGYKIISELAVDKAQFLSDVYQKLEGNGKSILSDSEMEFQVKNLLLVASYKVKIDVHHRRVRYDFDNVNIVMVIIFLIFGGMLFFSGRADSYFFYAGISGTLVFYINKMLTKARIEGAIRECLPRKKAPERKPSDKFSISREKECPACGNFLTGFECICPECGISLNAGQESISNYKNHRIRIFYKKNC